MKSKVDIGSNAFGDFHLCESTYAPQPHTFV